MLKNCVLLLSSVMLMTGVSQAGIITAITTLTGSAEIPPSGSAGIGSATITIDTVLNTMRVQVSFSGLGSNTTASHIHCCAVQPASVGVATTLPTFAGFPLGVTSGTYDNTLDLTLASSYNPSFVTVQGGTIPLAEAGLINGIVAGQSYLNIHTTNFGGGEIRGVLAVVPEPGTTMLMTAGLGVLLLAWRRRKA